MKRSPQPQRTLPLGDAVLKAPLAGMDTALSVLDGLAEPQVIELAEAGWLWAFDVGSPDAGRCEWRFLTGSLLAMRGLNVVEIVRSDATPTRAPESWEDVLKLVLPAHGKPWLTGAEAQRALRVGRRHLCDLLREGALAGTDFRRGRGGAPAVERQSLVKFLESRVCGGI